MSQIAKKPNGETIKKFSNELSQIKNHIQSTEQCLINEVLGMCKQIDPSYTNWHLFVGDKNKRTAYLKFVGSQAFREQTAYAMLVAVNMQLTQQGLLPQTPIVTQNMVNTFISSYQVALSLRVFFFSQFLNPGFDLSTKSRANFLWDEQILHFVGKQVDNEDIILLTSDTKMCDAAHNCGVRDKVMKYDEYVQELGVTPVFDAIKRGRLYYSWFRIKRAMNIS